MQLWAELKSIIEYSVFDTKLEKLALAIFVILLSLVMRQIFVKVVFRFIKKITANVADSFNGYFTSILETPVRFLIVVAGAWLATLILDLPEKSQFLVNRIFRSLVIYTIIRASYQVSDLLVLLLEKVNHKNDAKLDNMLLLFLRKSIKALILVIGFVTIIQEWYVNIGGLLAGLGLGGLAFALAAKDTVANLFGSITIMFDKTFKIGDWISTSGIEGLVEEIGFRSTRIRTFEQAVVTIPNSVISNQSITNWSRMGKRRLTFTINLKYNYEPYKIKNFLEYFKTHLKNHPEVHPETIIVRLERFEKGSMGILFYFFTRTTEWEKYLEAQEEINLKILYKLAEMNLELA
ncbi:MAG: mechanosensitive ion channel family protein [Bacillota bacterium]|nr:mechanosensitive ion channel family protein [Bacillota bacterium]